MFTSVVHFINGKCCSADNCNISIYSELSPQWYFLSCEKYQSIYEFMNAESLWAYLCQRLYFIVYVERKKDFMTLVSCSRQACDVACMRDFRELRCQMKYCWCELFWQLHGAVCRQQYRPSLLHPPCYINNCRYVSNCCAGISCCYVRGCVCVCVCIRKLT